MPSPLPAGFERRTGRSIDFICRTAAAVTVQAALTDAVRGRLDDANERLAGGRGATWHVGDLAIRQYRHGGLPGWFNRDLYCGRTPRPQTELIVTETLRQRNVPVLEVVGAAVCWIGPFLYRGWLATRFIEKAQTLIVWAQSTPASKHGDVWEQVGVALRRLHAAGGTHPDLNLNNVLVHAEGVTLIDFDRATLSAPTWQVTPREVARLERSARKLDPAGQWIRRGDIETLQRAYAEVKCTPL